MWTSCIRLIRVDYGFEIIEKDKDTGYILFDFKDSGMNSPASFEVIQQEKNGAPGVKILLTMAKLPSYMERMMLDKLERKIMDDYGPPPEVRKKPDKKEEKEQKDKDEQDESGQDEENDSDNDEESDDGNDE